MCEIAITAPDSDSAVKNVAGISSQLYAENTDGLGIVAVHRVADDQFLYNRYKRATPDFEKGSELYDFIDRNDGAYRFIIHARLATHGGTGWAETHPIQTAGCPECDIDMAVHNGVVYGEETSRSKHERSGHRYSTDVDSEVIAHEYGELPESLEDFEEPGLTGNLNYILFADDRILVRHSAKYNVSAGLTMATSKRGWIEDSAESSGIHLFHADGTHESMPIRGNHKYRNQGFASRAAGWASRAIGYGQGRKSRTQAADTCESETCESDAESELGTVVVDENETNLTTEERLTSDDDQSDDYSTLDMNNFPQAVPGELTEREPKEREWVTSWEDWHFCNLHGEEFYGECLECRRIDREVFDDAKERSVTTVTRTNYMK